MVMFVIIDKLGIQIKPQIKAKNKFFLIICSISKQSFLPYAWAINPVVPILKKLKQK